MLHILATLDRGFPESESWFGWGKILGKTEETVKLPGYFPGMYSTRPSQSSARANDGLRVPPLTVAEDLEARSRGGQDSYRAETM